MGPAYSSPKNPHRCLAVTSLWMTSTLSLALGTRKLRFMKLFIKDKSSCKLDSSFLLIALCAVVLFCSPLSHSKTKDFQYSLQLWSLIPFHSPTSSLLLNCEYSLRTCDTKSSAIDLEEHGIPNSEWNL